MATSGPVTGKIRMDFASSGSQLYLNKDDLIRSIADSFKTPAFNMALSRVISSVIKDEIGPTRKTPDRAKNNASKSSTSRTWRNQYGSSDDVGYQQEKYNKIKERLESLEIQSERSQRLIFTRLRKELDDLARLEGTRFKGLLRKGLSSVPMLGKIARGAYQFKDWYKERQETKREYREQIQEQQKLLSEVAEDLMQAKDKAGTVVPQNAARRRGNAAVQGSLARRKKPATGQEEFKAREQRRVQVVQEETLEASESNNKILGRILKYAEKNQSTATEFAPLKTISTGLASLFGRGGMIGLLSRLLPFLASPAFLAAIVGVLGAGVLKSLFNDWEKKLDAKTNESLLTGESWREWRKSQGDLAGKSPQEIERIIALEERGKTFRDKASDKDKMQKDFVQARVQELRASGIRDIDARNRATKEYNEWWDREGNYRDSNVNRILDRKEIRTPTPKATAKPSSNTVARGAFAARSKSTTTTRILNEYKTLTGKTLVTTGADAVVDVIINGQTLFRTTAAGAQELASSPLAKKFGMTFKSPASVDKLPSSMSPIKESSQQVPYSSPGFSTAVVNAQLAGKNAKAGAQKTGTGDAAGGSAITLSQIPQVVDNLGLVLFITGQQQ